MSSYLKNPELEELHLPSNPEWVVQMKKRASYGDVLAANSALVRVSTQAQVAPNGNGHGNQQPPQQVLTETETGAYLRTLVARMIVMWNLTDLDGKVLPINERTVEMLDPEDGDYLATEAQLRIGKRPEEQKAPLVNTSGQSSTDSESTIQRP